MNPAIVSDLEARFRPLTEAEKSVAVAQLDDAWAILLASVPTLQARHAAGAVSDALVRSVIAAMVIRVLRNPEGLRTFSSDEASFTRDNAVSGGALYVSAEEAALLSGSALADGAVVHLSFSAPYSRGWS